VPNLSHIWQRFLLTSSFFVGLAIGVVAAVFGYSNLQSVDVNLGAFHIDAIPLWTVAVVPLAVTLAAGALYHWVDGLHHFTEHMRHRHRVHELEAELATLRAHLDQVLEMPDHASLPAKGASKALPAQDAEQAELAPLEAATPASLPVPGSESTPHKSERRKRARLTVAPETAAAQPNGEKAVAESTAVTAEPAELPEPAEPAATAPG
jgi:hypothetical protein